VSPGRLAGRRVLVVGAGTQPSDDPDAPVGNGRAIAVLAAREGASILCADRDRDAAERTAGWIDDEGGTAEVLDLPEALEPLVEYFRSISGEHPDWDEYRQAMVRQGKSLLRITPVRWGPVATGGFPARLA